MHVSNTKPSDEWYRWAIQSIRGYAVFTTDLKGLIVTWNKGAAEVFGYRTEDVLGENARFIFTPADLARNAPEAEIASAIGNKCAPDERWHVRKDGSVFWASGLMMTLLDDHGRLVGFVKIVRERPPPDGPATPQPPPPPV